MARFLRPSALASLLFAPCIGMGALTENIGTNPIAMSLGNAVTADPPGVSAIHFNPAGLTRMKGEVKEDAVFGASVKPYASFRQPADFDIGGWTEDPLNGTSTGPVRNTLFIPIIGVPKARLKAAAGAGLGLAFRKEGSPWTFATSAYVTQAVGLNRTLDPNDPARFDGKKVVIQRLVYLSPAVGYKWSDSLSFGLSVPIAHQGFGLDTDMRMPNVLLGIVGKTQEGWCPENGGNILDTFTVGFCGGGEEGRINPFKKAANLNLELTAPVDPTINLGVLWEPVDWFGLGVVYQGGSKTKLSGQYTFNAELMLRKFVEGVNSSLLGPIVAGVLGMPQSIPEVQSGNATATIPFPHRVQLGFKLKPTPRVQFNVDANYTDWRTWDALTIKFDQSIKLLEMARLFGIPDSTQLRMPRGYKNTLHFGFGLQTKVTDKLTLRLGYEPRKSSVPLDKIDLVVPMPDTKLYGLGFNYRIDENTDISVSGSYMKGDFHAPARSSCNLNCDNFFNIVYNPYAGLDVTSGIRVRYFGLTFTKRF